MSTKPSQKAIAQALGVSASRISQLKREGMDVTSVAAAEGWYKRRVDPARAFGQRAAARMRAPATVDNLPAIADKLSTAPPPLPAPPAADPLERVAVLATRAERLLEAGRFGEVEDALRQALAAVDPADWHLVELPPDAWMHLTAEVRAAASEFEAEGDERAEGENSDMGAFWYAVAAGLVRATANNNEVKA